MATVARGRKTLDEIEIDLWMPPTCVRIKPQEEDDEEDEDSKEKEEEEEQRGSSWMNQVKREKKERHRLIQELIEANPGVRSNITIAEQYIERIGGRRNLRVKKASLVQEVSVVRRTIANGGKLPTTRRIRHKRKLGIKRNPDLLELVKALGDHMDDKDIVLLYLHTVGPGIEKCLLREIQRIRKDLSDSPSSASLSSQPAGQL